MTSKCVNYLSKTFLNVFISSNKCIYKNLAFEEKLFRTHDVAKGNCIFIWSNTPSVVIGRHQNPWLEANLLYLLENNIALARRHSGGGTVYHDEGNLNISILTEHNHHCRPKNLRNLSEILNTKYGTNIVPNSRDDMLLNPGERKISGTAARISKGKAYHHLTLLVDVDLQRLKLVLKSPYASQIQTNATRSVSAKAVGFLKQEVKDISTDIVMNDIITGFSNLYEESTIRINNVDLNTFDENDQKELENLQSWVWLYAKTPKFTYQLRGKEEKIQVEKGVIKELDCELGPILPF
uniref:BPL/LPL catalytic domain-containing protein n=1 Tax=Rhabditophanes sp. KR3021 TaxID=114890 RepID=A0AC35UH95_9BILA